MSITANEGGVLYTLDTITANEGGVLYPLDSVMANEDGVLYEIYGAIALPTSLEWRVDKTWSTLLNSYNTSKINTVSEDGLLISYTAQWATSNNSNLLPTILSNPVYIATGTTVSVDFQSVSGSGSTYKMASVAVHRNEFIAAGTGDSNALSASYNSNGANSQTCDIDIDESAEYVFVLNGGGFTAGQTSYYYPATITLALSFRRTT